MGNDPGLPGWAQGGPTGPYKSKAEGSESEKEMQPWEQRAEWHRGCKGAVRQGIQVAWRTWKRQGPDCPLQSPEGHTPADSLIFIP